MHILYVSPFSPEVHSGGGRLALGNLATLTGLDGATVEYVGPRLGSGAGEFLGPGLKKVFSRSFSWQDRLLALCRGQASALYGLYREWGGSANPAAYDAVFVESTRCGFVRRGRPEQRIVVMVQNVERDYMSYNQRGISRVGNLFIQRSERAALGGAETVLVLHSVDRDRLFELYGERMTARVVFHPAFSFPPKQSLIPWAQRAKAVLFIGSLNQRYNENGVAGFVSSCLETIESLGYHLIVAGRQPSARLKAYLERFPTVRLISDPPDAEVLLRDARLLVLPDLVGTGMKLRVAEAMSVGVPMVGTRLGLLGYETVRRFGIETEGLSDMSGAIKSLLEKPEHASHLAEGARLHWEAHYAFSAFRRRLQDIMIQPSRARTSA